MLLSHTYSFIFLHNRKTAGSSITVSLARYLGPQDLWIGSFPDAARHGVRPPNEIVIRALLYPDTIGKVRGLFGSRRFWSYVNASHKARMAHKLHLGPEPSHAQAADIANAYPEEWASYLKFCVVRNPWDKVASDYRWQIDQFTGDPPSFSEFVNALVSGGRLKGFVPSIVSNFDIYALNGDVAVDRIVRFEMLREDLDAVLAEIGVPWDGWLPRAKSTVDPSNRDPKAYRALYTEEDASVVGDLCQKEIQIGGYEF